MIVYKYTITAYVFVMALCKFDLLAVHTGIAFSDLGYGPDSTDHLVKYKFNL